MGVSGQRHAPAALLPPGKEPSVAIVQEAGRAPEPVWTQRLEEKILYPRRGSNPDRPVVQPVVRHYTAWANPAPTLLRKVGNNTQDHMMSQPRRLRPILRFSLNHLYNAAKAYIMINCYCYGVVLHNASHTLQHLLIYCASPSEF
jgi:hypothetical protein